ncbi:hypothetical protein GCM10011611_27340 [Aliidongia dinghuensis]|uniref:TonB C-terminal domain-containing protein n=1 Tax=Aliidongia dinghuensis TaxID=1867774 RepID=A0A8J2YUJ3_9PROT|nr:energy transducer TonB [Aliidongia dinghuensis]GGF19889.1 hypothetical protein GCM10011611_27340 [Aliidongia dinghuensis]
MTYTHGQWHQTWNPATPGRYAAGIVFAALVHLALLYVLVTGLGKGVVEIVRPPVMTKIIQDTKPPPPEQPPPPPPQLVTPPTPPYIPPPEVQIAQPPPQRPIAVVTTAAPPAPIPMVVAPPAPAPTPAPAVPDSEVSAKPIAGPPLAYPPRMLEAQREGKVDISCDVDADGTTRNCAVTSAQGGSAFSEAALAYVERARYKPAIRNGVPIKEPHHTFHIIFSIKD